MSDTTHISETVSTGQLRAFIERIERVEEEIKTLNADKSDIYKELRGVGFDVKAVRQCVAARKLDSAEREERNAIFDLYWEALTGASRVHVHEGRGVDPTSTPPHDPETGELTDTQEQPETNDEGSRPESQVGRDSAPDASEHGAAARPIHQDHDADRNGLVCGSGPTGDEAGTAVAHSPSPETPQATADEKAAPPAASSAPNPNPQPTSSPGADEAGGVPTPPSPASLSDADVPAFLRTEQRMTITDYRPNSLNPDACGATGLQHCYTCRKAMEAASETEAAA